MFAGFSANLIGSAILTTILSGRLHFLGYLICSLLFSSLMQPLIMHWIWHENGWLHKATFLNYKMSIKDYGGAIVIHTVPSTVGIVGVIFLGRRLIKLNEIDESSLGSESPSTTIIGYLLIIIGLLGFTIPEPGYEHTHYPYNYIGLIIINNLMAMSAAIIITITLNFIFSRNTFNYWIILTCIQGGVGGLVTLTAGVDVYNPYVSHGIGLLAGVIFYMFTNLINYTSIEDYCNIVSIHWACGLFGALLPAFLGSGENLGLSVSAHFKFLHFIWQLCGTLIVILTVSVIAMILFSLLLVTGFLRNASEKNNHKRSVNASTIERSCCLQRLFTRNATTILVEPGIGGKSPEIPLSARKSQDFQRTKERKQVTENANVRPERRVSYADNIDENNTKLIYTLHEIIHDAPPPILMKQLKCSGDCSKIDNVSNEIKQEAKVHDQNIKMKKKQSYYVLHRTRKTINLNNIRREYVRRKKTDESINVKDRNRQLMYYDKQFNDDIITFKMPINGGRKKRRRNRKSKRKL